MGRGGGRNMGLPGARCQLSDESITMTLGSKRLWMDLEKACAFDRSIPVNLSTCHQFLFSFVKVVISRG
jgi:hypothetical protein